MGTKIIITMAIITVGSAVTEKILIGIQKNDAAQILNFTTICGLGATGLGIFTKFIKTLASLG
jgi:hypothetical protein